jgi:hypothetical protein
MWENYGQKWELSNFSVEFPMGIPVVPLHAKKMRLKFYSKRERERDTTSETINVKLRFKIAIKIDKGLLLWDFEIGNLTRAEF